MWESDAREKEGSSDLDLAWMRVERRLPGMVREVAVKHAERDFEKELKREEAKNRLKSLVRDNN